MNRPFVCADCGQPSPVVNDVEGSSLISMKYGWRIIRRPGSTGEGVVEARCPTCWAKRRVSKAQA